MKNKELMRAARESLRGKWGLAIGTFLVYMIILGVPGSIQASGTLLTLIIGGPFLVGVAIFTLTIWRRGEARLEMIFDGFRNFTTAMVAYLLMVLYIVLWTLLLIVPGIIKALSYAMTFYILADHPETKAEDALKQSQAMMDGYKMKLFNLWLRFLLLGFLCILTLGIGFLWLVPYAHVTMAGFYDDLKNKPH